MSLANALLTLNPAQRDAVTAPLQHVLVLAGAGSGKTRVLVHRIAYLADVEGVDPWRMLALTFTNKAAAEMRGRAFALLGQPDGAGGLWAGTFHGICHRMLRQHAARAGLPPTFQVLDQDDQLRVVKRALKTLEVADEELSARDAQWFINASKDEGKRPEVLDAQGQIRRRRLIDVYSEYERATRVAGVVDFAELLLRAHELLLTDAHVLQSYQRRFTHVLVDEFQDTNAVQYAFVRVLAGEHACVFAVGDDDQSIYGWRGARVENVQAFTRDLPHVKTVRLEQNYRSTATILDAANAVIARNGNRLGKNLWTDGKKGVAIDVFAGYNDIDEARFVVERIHAAIQADRRPSESAVLYRSNALSRLIEENLIARQIPYRVYGGLRFFERAEVKDALAYLRLLAGRHDDAAFERVVATPPRGIGEGTLDKLRQHGRSLGISLWQAARSEALAGRARAPLKAFCDLIDGLAAATAELPIEARVLHVIEHSGLRQHYANRIDAKTESRLENLDQVASAAETYVAPAEDLEAGLTELDSFLAHAALEAGDGEAAEWEDGVQLMTLHSAKGLEFPCVYIVGLEDGLFPSTRLSDEPNKLEEERRLMYVGITRAREELCLSYAESRRMHGQEQVGLPSRFLSEIPPELKREIRPRLNVRPTLGPTHAPRLKLEEPVLPFKLGERLKHPAFGTGVLVQAMGSGARVQLLINFEKVGPKLLMASATQLEAVA
jgi:DNA helicase II / ATP-dependent DNA helicase PcrA